MLKTVMKINQLILFLVLISVNFLFANTDLKWPREIKTEKGLVTIYQPQLGSFKADALQGRMAISIKPKDGELLFCAAWFKAKMEPDFDEHTVTLESIEIPKVYFPDYNDQAKIKKITELLIKKIELWHIEMRMKSGGRHR